MAKIEPGSTSPDGFFEDIDDGEAEDEGSRLPLLIVIALLVLAAFGGVVWLAYNEGLQKGRADAPRPLVAQAATPQATKGIKVYEQPAPPDADTGETDSVPPPPDAMKPQAPAPQAQLPAAQSQAAPPGAHATPKAVTAPPATMAQAGPTPAAHEASAPPKPLVSAPPAKPVEQQATPAAKPESQQAAALPAATGGAYVLQIGSYKSQAEADAAWKAFQHRHAMLAGYSPDVKMVDLADKGTWYRLRAGGFATRDDAAAACARLKADGGDCLLAKR
ncbi:MAG TPA: SPOR domain-containing protein [Rhizomicrobium sp.]|nr:SPOR domain-containing protein [Rhizomicrobium sp.]